VQHLGGELWSSACSCTAAAPSARGRIQGRFNNIQLTVVQAGTTDLFSSWSHTSLGTTLLPPAPAAPASPAPRTRRSAARSSSRGPRPAAPRAAPPRPTPTRPALQVCGPGGVHCGRRQHRLQAALSASHPFPVSESEKRAVCRAGRTACPSAGAARLRLAHRASCRVTEGSHS
jgi:hypothetical protein